MSERPPRRATGRPPRKPGGRQQQHARGNPPAGAERSAPPRQGGGDRGGGPPRGGSDRGGPPRGGAAPAGTRQSSRSRGGQERPSANELWLFGEHAVLAAIKNQRRTCHQLVASEEGMPRIRDAAARRGLSITPMPNGDIARRLPRGAVHQGVAMRVAPLPPLQLERVIAVQPERSLPARRSAELGGTTAKAASGGLDMLPIVEVVNLSRALARLKEAGFRISGLDAGGTAGIDAAAPAPRRVLVVGSEGEGMRRLTTEHCDEVLSIPIDRRIDSLNVSVATSLALYALTRKAVAP